VTLQKYFPFIEHRYKGVSEGEFQLYDKSFGFYFGSIEAKGIENLPPRDWGFPRKSREMPVMIYQGRHRSHMDYSLFLLGLLRNKTYALTQAGENLGIGPADWWIRHMGSFIFQRFAQDEKEKVYYSPYWTLDWGRRILDRFGILSSDIEPTIITKRLSVPILEEYKTKLFRDGYDTNEYNEYGESESGVKSGGRSKDGRLNNFSHLIYKIDLNALDKAGRSAEILPYNVCLEEVVDALNMDRVQHVKKNFGGGIAYTFDFFYNLATILNVRGTRPKAIVNFGKPFEFSVGAYEREVHGNHGKSKAATVNKAAAYFAAKARHEVGMLEIPFCTQLLAKSVFDVYGLSGDAMAQLLRKLKPHQLKGVIRVDKAELEEKIAKNYAILKQKGVLLDEISDRGQAPSLDFVLNRTGSVLGGILGGGLYRLDGRSLIVKNAHVLSKYSKHIEHLCGNESK
jgi:hypothetical protein